MNNNNYHKIYCIHPQDVTTDFLKPIGLLFGEDYQRPKLQDKLAIIKNLQESKKTSLFIFLGHGSSNALYFENQQKFISKSTPELLNIVNDNDIFILACKSKEFFKNYIKEARAHISFGDIPSSYSQIVETDGRFMNITIQDIDIFNESYTKSIKRAFELLLENKISFDELPIYIRFFLNKEIMLLLSNKSLTNRKIITTLLFELKHDIKFSKK